MNEDNRKIIYSASVSPHPIQDREKLLLQHIEKLKKALELYGIHKLECTFPKGCICGLTDLIKEKTP